MGGPQPVVIWGNHHGESRKASDESVAPGHIARIPGGDEALTRAAISAKRKNI